MKTKHKLTIARAISRCIVSLRWLVGRSERVCARRGGILWELDLSQGIDLAIYMFGRFEGDAIACYKKYIKDGNIALDIGANIGAHALPMAQSVGKSGRVYAFEPTDFAFEKMRMNFSLNPALSVRAVLSQTMLVGSGMAEKPTKLPSSWSLTGSSEPVHPVHGGTFNTLNGAEVVTLDHWLQQAGLHHVDFVKLDVDGYELDVLDGAEKMLRNCRPTVVTEIAPYIFEERGRSLGEFLARFAALGYRCELLNGKTLPLSESLRGFISEGGSINVILKPA